MNLIAAAIPAFIVLMGVELWVARRRRQALYRFNDVVSDLGCGISSQLIGLAFAGLKLAIYAWTYERLHVLELPADSVWTALLAIVLLDFTYYWWHRASHRSMGLWAAHVVHHQSEDYNLAVALRQAWFTTVTIFPFNLPLAIIGIPVLPFALGKGVVTLYQFWIHTELIDRLGPLEWIFNTPSHHRVHHAVEPRYVDRNYAGIFIIWDRMFGTFVPEDERPTYGITTPLRNFNPAWANVHVWVEIVARMRATPRWIDKLRALVAPPRWLPPGVIAPPKSTVPLSERPKFDVTAARGAQLYAALSLVTTIAGTVLVLWFGKTWAPAVVVTLAACLVLATATATGIIEGKRWAWPLEGLRVAVTVALVATAL